MQDDLEDENLLHWRRFQDMSWSRLEDIMDTNKILLGISVYLSGDNKSKCPANKSIFHKSVSDSCKASPKCIN